MTADWEIGAAGGQATLHPGGDWVVLEMEMPRERRRLDKPQHVDFRASAGSIRRARFAWQSCWVLGYDAQLDIGDRSDISRLSDLIRASV